MRGLSRAPSPARCRNLPRVRHNVTRIRLRRRPLRFPPPQLHLHLPRLRCRHLLLRRLYRRQSPSLRCPRSGMRRSPRIPITRFHQNRSHLQKRLPPRKPSPMSPLARGSANGYRRFRCSGRSWITPGISSVASPRKHWVAADRGHLTFKPKARKKLPRTALARPSRPISGHIDRPCTTRF